MLDVVGEKWGSRNVRLVGLQRWSGFTEKFSSRIKHSGSKETFPLELGLRSKELSFLIGRCADYWFWPDEL